MSSGSIRIQPVTDPGVVNILRAVVAHRVGPAVQLLSENAVKPGFVLGDGSFKIVARKLPTIHSLKGLPNDVPLVSCEIVVKMAESFARRPGPWQTVGGAAQTVRRNQADISRVR